MSVHVLQGCTTSGQQTPSPVESLEATKNESLAYEERGASITNKDESRLDKRTHWFETRRRPAPISSLCSFRLRQVQTKRVCDLEGLVTLSSLESRITVVRLPVCAPRTGTKVTSESLLSSCLSVAVRSRDVPRRPRVQEMFS